MDKKTFQVRGQIINHRLSEPRPSLRVEAWDKDLIFHDFLGNAVPDAQGRFEISFDVSHFKELIFDRHPDVFFKVFDGEKLLLDTRNSALRNLSAGVHDVVIELPVRAEVCSPTEPEPPLPSDPGPPSSEPKPQWLRGAVVLSPDFTHVVQLEAFADVGLTESLGEVPIDACGRFTLELAESISAVWFQWSEGEQRGRSPKLQPFLPGSSIRLNVYSRWSAPTRGRERFQAVVHSTSGRPAVAVPVALLEVALKRCQLLGDALTNGNGDAIISYDATALFSRRPDLRLVVLDVYGSPLVESTDSAVVLPGTVAHTSTAFDQVAHAFKAEGVTLLQLLGIQPSANDPSTYEPSSCALDEQDLRYLTERSGLPVQSVATYAAAMRLAPHSGVPPEALFALANSRAPDLTAALEDAVAQDIVSPALLERSRELVPLLNAAGTKWAAQWDLGHGSFDEFLTTQVSDEKVREQITGIVFEHKKLSAVREALEKQKFASPPVRFLLDLQAIAGVDVTLARIIGDSFTADKLPTGQDLALRSTREWVELLKQAQQQGEQQNSQKEDEGALQALRLHALVLKLRAQHFFPEKVFQAQLDRYADKAPWAQHIRSYFEKHPERSFFSPIPLSELAGSQATNDPEEQAELAALSAYKHMHALTHDHGLVGELLEAGFTLPEHLAAIGIEELRARFIEDFEDDFILLKAAHSRALAITSALNAASSFLPVGPRPSLCDCMHCRSIFGPAAYLFELLAVFRRYTTTDGRSLLWRLDERRPDVKRTHLSCPNTTIEVLQIDLVSEILEDQILNIHGTSLVHALGDTECLPLDRQTRGTSEERRATPQNPPSDEVVRLLAEARFPWSLPYDYHGDKAHSARDRLITAPEDVALTIWRFTVSNTSSPADATSELASATLDLTETQVELITEGLPLEDAWGSKVTGQIASSGPELQLLAQIAATDLATLETVLDSTFVRGTSGTDDLHIEPEDFCDSEDPPRLVGSPDTLEAVLDRLHRFERLRRHLGWQVRELDEALVWLGGILDRAALTRIGMLRFLERRLRLSLAELLTLFRDPGTELPVTLRPRRVLSAFEEQFGLGSLAFKLSSILDDRERIQFITAQIAKVAGESVATVDHTFEAGLVAPLASVADLLDSSAGDIPTNYRRVVAATYRLSRWARRLRIEEAELLGLVALSELSLLVPGVSAERQLQEALRLVDLVEQSKDWPLKLPELRYLISGAVGADGEHGLAPSRIEDLLLALHQELEAAHKAQKPLPPKPRAALRVALARLLTVVLPGGAAEADSQAGKLASALEWGAFFPARAAGADTILANTLHEWRGLGVLPAPAREAELNDALHTLREHLEDWLGRVPEAPATWPIVEFDAVEAALATTLRARLADPGDEISTFQASLENLFTTAGVTLPNDLAHRLMALALDQIESALESVLAERAEAIFNQAVESTVHRTLARKVLEDWVARSFRVPTTTAATLLDHLSHPDVSGMTIAQVFVNDAGVSTFDPEADPALDPIAAVQRNSVLRLHRAALALRGITLPPTLWEALAPAAGRDRVLDLNLLTGGASLVQWQEFFALAALFKRLRSPQATTAFIGFLAGEAIPRADLLSLLNVGVEELEGTLHLLGVSDASVDPVTLPQSVDFGRLRAMLALVDQAKRYKLSPTALARWYRASPQEVYEWALAGLRVGLEPSEWLGLLAEVTDPVRSHLRDAQLDLLIASHQDGAPGAAEFSSREAISDYLLTDVQMSPCMTTSRIQFAYAAVQRYVATAQGGRAHWITRTDDQEKFAREWASLRQYRLHEAQMRILVHTENWIDPALRPTKTPAFERLEQTMNSGPLTLQLAEQAIKAYAAELTEIARLEPVAIVTHGDDGYERPLAFRDSELYGTHVFARTRAHPQRLYYRRRLPSPDERWTPWERVDVDLEGTHYLAVVVFGRLRLICADFSVARSVRPERCSSNEESATDGFNPAGQGALIDYEVTLSWIDREYGRWSQVKRSERFPFSIDLGTAPPDEDYVYEALPDHFGVIVKGNSWITELTVQITLGNDGMDQGSKMRVFLRNDDGNRSNWFAVGSLDDQKNGGATYSISPSSIPETPRLDEMTRIRLEWHANWKEEFSDDCDVGRIQVRFSFGDGLSHIAGVSKGRKGHSYDDVNWASWEDVPVDNMRFEGGGLTKAAEDAIAATAWDLTGGSTGLAFSILELAGKLRETPQLVFEAAFEPVNLDSIPPQQSYFDMEWELVPQSIDLSRAITLQVTENDPSSFSFDLTLFSVPHQERGRIRSRFKVKDQGVPEEAVKVWGTDWVNGKEFCYSIQTDDAVCARLRIHADDTIEKMMKPGTPSLGYHRGTKSVGQALLSTTDTTHEPAPVCCDDQDVATAPVAYNLTVQRTQILSSWANPKILDETHSSQVFARTFFLERVGKASLPANAPADPPLVIRTDWFLDPSNFPWPGELFDVWNVPQGAQTMPAATHVVHNNEPSPWRDEPTGALAPGNPLYFLAGAEPLFIRNIPLVPFGAPTRAGLTPAPVFDTSDFGPVVGELIFNEIERNWAEATRPGIWRFHTFWHPQAVGFRRVLEARGLARLVRVENQALLPGTDLDRERGRVHHFSAYRPTNLVDHRWPSDTVDFTVTGAYSEYNWELFFDSLLYCAQRFDEEGQFDDADEIFALLLDQRRVAQPGVWEDDPTLYQTAPLRASVELELKLKQQGLASVFDDVDQLRVDIAAQIARIRQNPYQPHLIARGWPSVYARALKIRYVEHLIQAGEFYFRRAYNGDNRTFLESASARFDLAARVLGPAEGRLPASPGNEPACYASLSDGSFTARPATGIEVLDLYLPDMLFSDEASGEDLRGSSRRYFCVPENDKLDELRALVADRLLKLRSCQDIDGVRRALSLYGQRIDPALLVRATAQGIDLDVVLGRLVGAKPSLYFQALWQRALQACERARALEDAWLNAEERVDSEEYARMQNEQEIRALEGQVEVVAQRLEDARKLKEALDRSVESAEIRHEFYATRKRLNAQEEAEGKNLQEAGKADARAAGDSRTASDWAWVPTAEVYADVGVQAPPGGPSFRAGASIRYRLGGETGVQVYRANAEAHNHDAARHRVEAGLMGREGSFQRRTDDWKLQEALALKDIQRGEHDLAGAEIRVHIAELELDLHQRRIDDVKAIRTFLHGKFTSKEFQSWRANRMRQLRYQQHRIAYDLVSQAKAALVREHGLEDQGFVPDPWDASRHGVAAAAGLLHELEKQQQLYMETWRREQEKIKSYSLAERDPLAFLELIQRGEAVCSITEVDYDEDGAGDYFRRIRSVSLDIPAVRGPYININARLTQLRGEVRKHSYIGGDYYRQDSDDTRFRDDLVNGESIVTNTGVQDDGRVDQRQDSENPPPFAMNGAISTFRLELPHAQNHFDRQTISDVIVRVVLTSRAGGDAVTRAAIEARRQWLAARPQPIMLPLHSSFSNVWHRFVNELAHDSTGTLLLKIELAHIPLRLQPVERIIESSLYFSSENGSLSIDGEEGTLPPALQPGESSNGDPHIPPPVYRLKLRDRLQLDQERQLRISGGVPKRGWLICWVAVKGRN
ncbi:neuraminidase-like domain-containing protein [Nitrosomonas nitrosa]|uniref:Tc toxin subunit A-related protein n=1 Tax=Nitrosomonas nitrosa TaxID=52442 RepID=UPI0023F720F9|nr:neuraminidase-like domain-containing protein [Nitrosomonas nitrosa]MCO6432689.1 hypothetical protein [Nitrosomonas nitrosa]